MYTNLEKSSTRSYHVLFLISLEKRFDFFLVVSVV